MIIDVLIKGVLAFIVLFSVLSFAGLHAWIERKQSAVMQDRIGANRASIFGFTLLGVMRGPGWSLGWPPGGAP